MYPDLRKRRVRKDGQPESEDASEDVVVVEDAKDKQEGAQEAEEMVQKE